MQNCYNSKKISRGEAEDLDGRLTTKHIQTLSFLQEIVNENKALKARLAELEDEFSKCSRFHEVAESAQQRIKDMQQQYLERADEINRMLTEKHQQQMMKKVEEGVETEKKWLSEKHKLQQEIERLKKENSDLQSQLATMHQQLGKSDTLLQKITKLEKEIERLKAENKKLTTENTNQKKEVQRLQYIEDKNTNLTEELTHANNTIKELEFRIAKLQKDAGTEGLKQQEELMNSLRINLQKLHKEKSIWEQKDQEYQTTEEDLKAEIAKLRKALGDSERMRGEMHVQLDQVIEELNLLKNRSTQDNSQAFKEFVKVKRELGQVREENEELRARLRTKKGSGGPGMLPHIDGDRRGSKSVGSGQKEAGWNFGKGT